MLEKLNSFHHKIAEELSEFSLGQQVQELACTPLLLALINIKGIICDMSMSFNEVRFSNSSMLAQGCNLLVYEQQSTFFFL